MLPFSLRLSAIGMAPMMSIETKRIIKVAKKLDSVKCEKSAKMLFQMFSIIRIV